MLENCLDISLQGNFIHIGSSRQTLPFENDFFIPRWTAATTLFFHCTQEELTKNYRILCHPSVRATLQLLKRANNENFDSNIEKELANIIEDCNIFLKHSSPPRRFNQSMGREDYSFNNRVLLDTMFIEGIAAMNLVDESAHYTATAFHKYHSSATIWK